MAELLKLREKIKTEAICLGFKHFGIAPATPVPHYEDYLKWLAQGHHGEMKYLSRGDTVAKRGDPRLILEDCKTVICLTMPYLRPESPAGKAPAGKGRISAYARSKDYHEIIWGKLHQLEAFIHNQTDKSVRTKSYVDTGPILERAYAVEAGIGVQGKNSCLLIPGAGSYFFLAEVLTNLDLPLDEPFTADLCKNCTRCVEACPTECILPDRTIDASRCVSYLTIENKKAIPLQIREKIGDWFFGCDICQMVCPHNHFKPENHKPFTEPILPEFLDLRAIFSLDDADFQQCLKSPLSRAKRRGILRNAAIVLGNQRDALALPALKAALRNEKDPIIVESCQWAIEKIESAE